MYLQSKNKRANCQRNAEGNRQKMTALHHFAFFQQTMENDKCRKRRCADRAAQNRAEKRAEQKNNRAARAARDNSPEHSDERQKKKHRPPRIFFYFAHGIGDDFAGKITDNRRNQIDDKQHAENPDFAALEKARIEGEFGKKRGGRENSEKQAEIGKRFFEIERIFHHFRFNRFFVRLKCGFLPLGFGVGGEKNI